MVNELEELLATNFVGGTLVEYLENSHFGIEWGRSIITDLEIRKGLEIVTEGGGYFELKINDITEIRKKNGVFYLKIPNDYSLAPKDYALASKGVNIPIEGGTVLN